MKKLLCIVMILPLFVGGIRAYGIETYGEKMLDEKQILDNLNERERMMVGTVSFDGSYDVKSAMERLYHSVIHTVEEKLKLELGFAIHFVVLAVISSLITAVSTNKRSTMIINMVSCSVASILVAGDVDGIVNQGVEAVMRLSDYSKAAMPAIFSAAAASGAPVSSAAKYAAASMSIDLLITCCNTMIIPLIKLFVCVSISKSIFENPIILSLAKFLKWLVTGMMTTLTMTFTAYISFTGLISGSVDAATVKTTRTIIANSVPVVGKIISDASSVVLAGANIIKNSAGIISLIAVTALCISPFVVLAIKLLVFKATAALVEMLPGVKLSGLFNDFGTVFGMLLGMMGCCGVMLFVSIVSGIKVLV